MVHKSYSSGFGSVPNSTPNEIEDRSINPLIRIADALDTIIDMIKKDQEESKKRWAEKDE
jgi:hypothetical protein